LSAGPRPARHIDAALAQEFVVGEEANGFHSVD
jgi:hypothetical protein